MNREFLRSGELIPLSGKMPAETDPGGCAEYLLDILEADQGIVGVDYDTGSGRLGVQYDTTVLPSSPGRRDRRGNRRTVSYPRGAEDKVRAVRELASQYGSAAMG